MGKNIEQPEYKKEKNFIHEKLETVCNLNNKDYKKYKKWCDEYFYLPHRKESRGIGGIFFDYATTDWLENFNFVSELGLGFIRSEERRVGKEGRLRVWQVQ